MWQYNLRVTKEELEALNRNGSIRIADEIHTNCDSCSEDIDFEIQIILDNTGEQEG